jgi:hypothetical protein
LFNSLQGPREVTNAAGTIRSSPKIKMGIAVVAKEATVVLTTEEAAIQKLRKVSEPSDESKLFATRTS